jgi:hypothetical protein
MHSLHAHPQIYKGCELVASQMYKTSSMQYMNHLSPIYNKRIPKSPVAHCTLQATEALVVYSSPTLALPLFSGPVGKEREYNNSVNGHPRASFPKFG